MLENMLEKTLGNWKSLLRLSATFALSAVVFNQATAQCESWEAYPGGVQQAKEQHVIYKDMFKSKMYAEAFPTWKNLFATVKIPLPAKTTHFEDGITMYKEFAKVEEDEAKKEEHIQNIIALYDEMAACLGEKSYDRAWAGYDIYSLSGDSKQAIAMFEKAISLGKNQTNDMVFIPITQLAIFMFVQKDPKFTADYMRNLYDTLKGIADYNIQNKTKDAAAFQAKWDRVHNEFKTIGDQIWGCDFHVAEWKPKFEEDKLNMVQNEDIMKLLLSKCGEENPLYIQILDIYQPWRDSMDIVEDAIKFEGYCNFKKGQAREKESKRAKKAGDDALAQQLKNEAFDWYEKSLDDKSTEDCETTNAEKGELAYGIAYNYYNDGNFSKARSYCNKAADLKPGWGDPYMLIGNMYASSGKTCSGGAGTGWDAQVVVWAAIDVWEKARNIDGAVAAKANGQIAKYKKYMPTKADIFQRGLKEGASYSVGCWIGVSTTIRAGGE